MKTNINAQKLAQLLKQYPGIIAAYLIGSVAEGRERQDSDLDIVLLAEKNFDLNLFGPLYQKINSLVGHPNLDLRIVIPEKTDPLFLFQLLGGKLLYARNQKELISLEVKIMKLYYDSQHLRNIFHYYLNRRLEGSTYGR